MRQIKFRGHALYDSCGQSVDKIVYGDLFQEYDKVDISSWDDGDTYEVTPESVSQLVEIDANGKEVYEGDTIVDQHGIEYTAYLVGIADGETEFVRLDDEIETASFEFNVKDE